MSKFKLITIKMSATEYTLTSNHYSRMGFELVDISHYKGTHYRGSVGGNNVSVTPHDYDYYECLYKFDMARKNASKLWKLYKQYKEKKKQVSRKEEESRGEFSPTKAFLPLMIILAIIIFPFVPMLFENDFGEFSSWKIGLFSSHKSFDTEIFVGALFLSPLTGASLTLFFELISFAFTHKKRRLNAIAKIPVLNKELEELTIKAQSLQNQ